MPTNKTPTRWLLATILAAVLLTLAVFFSSTSFKPTAAPETRIATLLAPTKPVIEFKLQDHTKKDFTDHSFKGKWNVLFFGYTYCPDICPITLKVLNQAYSKLDQATKDNLRIVFISVDPDRDNPEQLSEYVGFFNADFIGLTGEQQQIDRLTQSLGIAHTKNQKTDENNYLVDHSSSLLLINPDGHFQGLFSAPHQADDLSHDLNIITRL